MSASRAASSLLLSMGLERAGELLEAGDAGGDDPVGQLASPWRSARAAATRGRPGPRRGSRASCGRGRRRRGWPTRWRTPSSSARAVTVPRSPGFVELDQHLHLGERRGRSRRSPGSPGCPCHRGSASIEGPELDRQLATADPGGRTIPALLVAASIEEKVTTLQPFHNATVCDVRHTSARVEASRSVRRRTYVGHRRMREAARLDHNHLWHPFTQQTRLGRRRAADDRAAEGSELIDTEGRRYLDGVSSLWCNVHGHRHPVIDEAVRRPARPGRPLDHAGPLPPRARPSSPRGWWRSRPRPEPGLLLRLRLDGRRGCAEDGLPVLAASRWPARPEDLIHLPGGCLPRGHDRLGLRRGHGPLPLRLRAAPVRDPPCASRRHRRTARACSRCARRRSPPW